MPTLFQWTALSAVLLLFGSRAAYADCRISGARPTVALPTMLQGQEFTFNASPDCETLRFTIRGTTISKIPQHLPLPLTDSYWVVLTESEWNAVVAGSGATITWVVTGMGDGIRTRLVTTNEIDLDVAATFDLSMADAKLVGEAGDYAALGLSGAGDVNGDGNDDLLVGAYQNDAGGADAGAAYLVLGPVSGTMDLALADAMLVGEEPDDEAGLALADAGDVDGDGRDDVIVGARYNGDAGAAYVVLGPVSGTRDLSMADAKLVGEGGSFQAGRDVSGAGDVDGDGHDDVLVGSHFSTGGTRNTAYLVLGPVTGSFDLGLADAKLEAEPALAYGITVSEAGDVTGDGHDDLLIGSYWDPEAGDYAGAAYVVAGPVVGTLDLALADAKLLAEASGDRAGASVASAGDVDGDGNDDLVVGAPENEEGGFHAGAAYLVLGPVAGTRDLAFADAKLVGSRADDLGDDVAGAGDVDGDGHDDLLVGASGTSSGGRSGAGAAYLVLGPVTGTLGRLQSDVRFVGATGGEAAGQVAAAGDVDADGRTDLLIGAYRTSTAYVIYAGGL